MSVCPYYAGRQAMKPAEVFPLRYVINKDRDIAISAIASAID